MSNKTMQLISENIAGFSLHDNRCIPCFGVSGRMVSVSFCSSPDSGSIRSRLKLCRASSSGNGRDSEFWSQGKHGVSRNWNKKAEENGFDNFEKLNPSPAFSNSPRSQAAPGRKEKEIVELFRKVQAQLRERAANKDGEKKIEALHNGQAKESTTVDSLLKLMRKHTAEQSKKTMMDQQDENGSVDAKDIVTNEPVNVASVSRPASNFRRRSPVSRVKSQSVQFDNIAVFNGSIVELGKENEAEVSRKEPCDEPEQEQEPILSVTTEFDETIDEIDVVEDVEVVDSIDQEDLSGLKLLELRKVAKARGVKGYSKLRKGELLELLSGSSI